GDSAGRLVQAAGLKGEREGAAVVSTLHGNFIVNEGGATAADVRRLIERVMGPGKQRSGVPLEPAVERGGRWEGRSRFCAVGGRPSARSRCALEPRSRKPCARAATR